MGTETPAKSTVDWSPLAQLAPLLVYPTRELPSQLPLLRALFEASGEPMAPELEVALSRLAELTFHELEELYTQIFDLNPVCTLEVGWHLYGEQYERGRFLVRTRDLLMSVGQGEAGELPDFLPTLLLALPRLEAERAVGLAAYLVPALRKMCDAFGDEKQAGEAAQLYLPILRAVRAGLEARVPKALVSEVETRFRPAMVAGRMRGLDPGPNGDFPLDIVGDTGFSGRAAAGQDGIVKLGVDKPRGPKGAVSGIPISEIPMEGKPS